MPSFKPYAIINITETTSEIRGHYRQFKTYQELKKNLGDLLKESNDNEVHVLRSRRGQWGEWNEKWKLVNNKPTKYWEGWS